MSEMPNWQAFVRARQDAELESIIEAERLKPEETRRFMEAAFRDGAMRSTGTAITQIMPPMSRFALDNTRSETKKHILDRLGAFFERFFGLS